MFDSFGFMMVLCFRLKDREERLICRIAFSEIPLLCTHKKVESLQFESDPSLFRGASLAKKMALRYCTSKFLGALR